MNIYIVQCFFVETEKNYLLIALARNQPISWDCPPLKYLEGPNNRNYARYIENRSLKTCQHHFANILQQKIFMKFQTYAQKIVIDYQNSFGKDPCTLACT